MSKHRKSRSEAGRSRGTRHGGPGQPVKCPDCGTWFVSEHRCEPVKIEYEVLPQRATGTYEPLNVILCTCPPNRGATYLGRCPVHDVMSSQTTRWYVS